jgi:hypothetical protein
MDFMKKAEEKGFTLQRTPAGVVVVPLRDGEPMSAEEFSSLPQEEQDSLQKRGKDLQQKLNKILL